MLLQSLTQRKIERSNMNDSQHLALELIRYRIHQRRYSQWRAIFAEMGESDTNFLKGLKETHGLKIDKAEDPILYVTEDTQQLRTLKHEAALMGSLNFQPTMLQILLTSRVIALSEEEAKARFEKYLELLNRE